MRVWPVAITFDRRTETSATMICDESKQFRYDSFIGLYSTNSFLAKYNFKPKAWVNTIHDVTFSTAVLIPIQQSRILCAETKDLMIQKLWIINAETFEPVCVHHIPDDGELLMDATMFWHTLAVESISSKTLYVTFWRFMGWEGQKNSFVITLTVPEEPWCNSLKHICRKTILRNVHKFDKNKLMMLRLPHKLSSFLEGYDC